MWRSRLTSPKVEFDMRKSGFEEGFAQTPRAGTTKIADHAAKPEVMASAGGLQALLPGVKQRQRFDGGELVDAQSLQFGQKHHCL